MKGEELEHWQTLCSQAAEEQDPQRLLELVKQINDLLQAKEERLNRLRSGPKPESEKDQG